MINKVIISILTFFIYCGLYSKEIKSVPEIIAFQGKIDELKQKKISILVAAEGLELQTYTSKTGVLQLNIDDKNNCYIASVDISKITNKQNLIDNLKIEFNNNTTVNIPYFIYIVPENENNSIIEVGKQEQKINNLSISESKINIPYLEQGREKNIILTLTNNSDVKYNFGRLDSGCSSCSTVTIEKKELLPNESSLLSFAIRKTIPGNFSQTIWLTEKDNQFEPQAIVVNCNVPKIYDFSESWSVQGKDIINSNYILYDTLNTMQLEVIIKGESKFDDIISAKTIKVESKYFKVLNFQISTENNKLKANIKLKIKTTPEIGENIDWIKFIFDDIAQISHKVVFTVISK